MGEFSTEEYKRRINKITNYLLQEDFDGFMIFNPYNIFYLGLYHVVTKRPIALFVHKTGKVDIFTPKMELEEAKKLNHVDRVYAYDDNFTESYDMFDFIKNNIDGKKEKILVDSIGARGYLRLCSLYKEVKLSNYILEIRAIKSYEEIEMLKKAAFYSDYIVSVGKELIKPGNTELGILSIMESKTINKMIEDMGEIIYVPGGPAGGLIPSGTRTALPHALPSGKAIETGDTMILSCGANVWGYRIECERTFFVGEPDRRKIEAFNVMKASQELAASLMKPGAICEDIEHTIIEFITEHGYGEYIKHRTGHGKGLEEHEPPYIASGDKTIIKPGMIFSSEPGIYIEGFSGFRHSDIVWVTEKGPEILTKYPKNLESLIVEI